MQKRCFMWFSSFTQNIEYLQKLITQTEKQLTIFKLHYVIFRQHYEFFRFTDHLEWKLGKL